MGHIACQYLLVSGINISISNLHFTSCLVGQDGWVGDLFLKEDITVIGGGGFAGVVGVGHNGDA
jgi:hypothetical protein